jgi:hypothetical protein
VNKNKNNDKELSDKCMNAVIGGRAAGLRLFAYWDCGFEFFRMVWMFVSCPMLLSG